MKQSDKLDREVAEMEAAFRTPEGDATTAPEAPTSVQGSEVAPPKEELVTQPAEPAKPAVQEAIDGDWEKRYKGLRGSRDQKLIDARAALANQEAQILELQRKLTDATKAAPKPDVLEGIIDDEAREALGPTAIEAMTKTAQAYSNAKNEEVERQLEELRKEKERLAEQRIKASQAATYQSFLNRLATAVPDYASINVEPAFKEYMQALEVDGQTRAEHFHSAEQRGDVAIIANYMLNYKREKIQANPLESKIVPTGQGHSSTSTNSGRPPLTSAEIDLHYERDRKGWYKGRLDEFNAMERRIEEEWSARY